MNEIDILKKISENLSIRKSTVLLNNYEVLCNNIKYVNNIFEDGLKFLKSLQNNINKSLKNDSNISVNFKNNEGFYFRKIIPRILFNDINIIEKFILYTKPDDRTNIEIDNVIELQKKFIDFNNLVTVARQFIDSLVSDSYQLILLEVKEINFHVLTSLNSFSKYATKSIKEALFNKDVLDALKEFEKLTSAERINGKPSSITKCDKRNFREKVDFLFSELGLINQNSFQEEIKNLFSFSSEFTHIGYVSTLFTGSEISEPILGDDISPYLPSTENFNELKYQILETSTKFFSKIYLPSIKYSLKKILDLNIFTLLENNINKIIIDIDSKLSTRNNEYYFFIVDGLIGSQNIIDLPCMCGEINHWKPPHDKSTPYCKKCGSTFHFLIMKGDPGYIITNSGPIKVIGSKHPDFDDLPIEEQLKLLNECNKKKFNI